MHTDVDVLVTGGGGFIGSALARALVARGDDVRVLDNFLTGSRARVPDGAELVEADLRDAAAVADACRGAEVVFHQAALRSVPKSVDQPRLATECNVMGTLSVLMGAASAGVRRVVYASSSSVYGQRLDVLREDDMPDPRSPYAASKLAGEQYCRVWTHLHGLSTVSLRYFNVFGPGQSPDSKYSAVFPAFISALLRGEAPEVHWDGEQAKDFTFVDDVVHANLLAAAADERADGAVINVGGGRPKSVNEVLRLVSEHVGTWIDPRRTPKRQGDVRRSEADITRAAELLGWTPATPWEAGVEATVDWFRRTPAATGAR
jgi:nucleoside-diphosphate-sugar epimerase